MLKENSAILSSLLTPLVVNQLIWALFVDTWQEEARFSKIHTKRGFKSSIQQTEVRSEMLRVKTKVIIFHNNVQKIPSIT